MRWWVALGVLLSGGVMAGAALADPLSADQERALKRAHATPLSVLLPIDWAAALNERQTVALPDAARERVDQARQPVLLPAVDGLTARAFLTIGDGWYTAALPGQGVHLEVQGSARAQVRPALAAEQAAAGYGTGAPRIAQMHGIFTLSFERFGVSYAIDLECASHTDPRCADASYLMTIYDSLVVAGGRP